ncbi:MAG: DUF1828 domain-containing protein [Deltaproteobacteria bacterium]
MSRLDDIRAALAGQTVVADVAQLPKPGHIRIETKLLYPDGSCVDVFIRSDGPLFREVPGPLVLSDLGQTTAWLLDVGVRPWLSKKRQQFVTDTLRVFGATQIGGEIRLSLDSPADLSSGILRLGQACLRVADLTFTRRASLVMPFAEDVEEVFADAELIYEPSIDLVGRFGSPVSIDYLVTGKHTKSAVLTLTSATAPAEPVNVVETRMRRV